MSENTEEKTMPETVSKAEYDKLISESTKAKEELEAKLNELIASEVERKDKEKKEVENNLKKQNEWEKLANEREAELEAKNLELSKLAEQNKTFKEINENRRIKKLNKYIEINKISDDDKTVFQDMNEDQLDYLLKASEVITVPKSAGVEDGTIAKEPEPIQIGRGRGNEKDIEFLELQNKAYNN